MADNVAAKLPFSELNYKNDSGGFTRSLIIYAKFMAYYPMKYALLLFIFLIILKVLSYALFYGNKAYEKLMKFVDILMNLGTLNLIIIKFPNFARLAEGLIDLAIGFGYFCIALVFFIIACFCMIPFNMILPHYVALL
jgi:hypothetical protein